MKTVNIDLSLDKTAVHRMLAEKLDFPPYYGNNLDALYDIMSTYSDEVVLHITGESDYGKKILKTIEEAALENKNIKIEIKEETAMTITQAKEQLAALQAKLAAYNHATAILYYDGATAAPKGTGENRAQTMAVLGGEIYNLSTGKETVELLEFLDEHKEELSEKEQRIVFLMLKSIRQMQKIPADQYIELQMLLSKADDVWHTAKDEDNFEMFRPYLEKVFDFYKRIANWCEPEKDPYDYWLGEFEDGLNKAKCDEFFAAMRSRIVPLLKKISEKEQLSDECIHGNFPEALQHQLTLYIMDVMGIDKNHCAVATTEHPFTTTLGSHADVRITTKYHENDFSNSLYSVVHEGGHALYELNVSDDFARTVLDGGVSMGIHESQSRFYENYIGRSREFISCIFPKLCEIFPQLADYTAEDVYKAVNRVQPGLIRIDADELTYCLHIMVRYELEKRIFAGELEVKDLPAEWNKMYREYLGVDVPNDKKGVLQDSHWSGGNIGYFPSYALGSAYGAQFLKKMKETVNVEECVKNGNLAPVNEWNREHIWQYGQLRTPSQILESTVGSFDPMVFADYLEAKFTELYNL
ncbi:MAG: barstar family protein [Oscillospiraceae bacterium]|nr:barstar family protein [Oscillospiraceae bacterium]